MELGGGLEMAIEGEGYDEGYSGRRVCKREDQRSLDGKRESEGNKRGNDYLKVQNLML